ncbi:MAG: efflux RND transporter permease subunit [Sphingomonadales bacterium]|nr:efflux RND transporter permease subunit [Sphingomonadales bacterium]PIX64825.1 MAG: AcrB/AcrD/AcrF family protein [Sphingomonadales bacterium CG_4_10_14_3_um_filter_58_15]NCO48128.1 efflux RND transporter permease subunit [Sphingomonadales bacterium]NCP01502.1 efflux RND transporter permease subunit [Sphingomonadales bacterium]NCP28105.1 efflux RND transporter permease subunit [Sphingomonadales bacterium]
MTLTNIALRYPAAIAAGLALIALIGIISIFTTPIQLFPNIEQPQISMQANWRAASPKEMESEITIPIEEQLRGIPGLETINSWSNNGNVWFNLEFALGTNMDKAFAEVSSRAQQVRNWPLDADRPIVGGANGQQGESLIYLFLQALPDSNMDSEALARFARDTIIPKLETIEGVQGVDLQAPTGERILRIRFDPWRLAQLNLTIEELSRAVGRFQDVGGGTVDVGRRGYALRFEGNFTAEQIGDLTVAQRGTTVIRMRDVADINVGPDKAFGATYQNGNPAIGMQVIREPGSNTLDAINAVLAEVKTFNENELRSVGARIEKSFDPSVFIKRALSFLGGNLLLGTLLAVGLLWLFVRRTRATVLIAATVPVCLLVTLAVLGMAGRTINVISLAGLAFATGMVLDAAIVVMENFVRIRKQGKGPGPAALEAVAQVWPALFASTATTVAIFIPIMFIKDVEGQLFADLALTIAISVIASLIVAVTVLPAAARRFAGDLDMDDNESRWDGYADRIFSLIDSDRKRRIWIPSLILAPMVISYFLWPQTDYLPDVKRDAVDAWVGLPSGQTLEAARTEIAEKVVQRLDPYLKGEKQPELLNYYLFVNPWGLNTGIRIKDQSRIEEMTGIVNNEILAGFPDVQAFAQQGSLFGNFGGNGSIELYLQAEDDEALRQAALVATDSINAAIPGAMVRPNPDPNVVVPELRLTPNDRRIAELGMTREQVGRAVRAMGDGLYLGEYVSDGERMRVIMRGLEAADPEAIESAPIVTPNGGAVPLGEVATLLRGVGPTQIAHVDGRKTLTINVAPPPGMALGDALEKIEASAEGPIRNALPAGGTLRYGGDADALMQAISSLSSNFILAAALLFVIMASVFRSAWDSALVIIALPLATVGGVIGIQILNLFKPTPLDLLGMIGFVILLGIVVNNAILLMAQARDSEAEGMTRSDAAQAALRLRLRPILMTTGTSVMGMLPLALVPGPGSAIYRGLAVIIVGGVLVSTIFTLVLLPALIQLGGARKARPTDQGSPPQYTGRPVLEPAE